MAYTKQTWASGETISAARLNHMEDGIFDAHEIIKNRPIASGDDGTADASNASNLSNSTIASTSYVANYAEGKINSLPTATANRKGFVQIGEGLSIDSAGVISIPAATTSSKGLIQVGNNLSIDNGVISAVYATEGTYNSNTNKLVTKNAMDTAISSAVTSAINAIPTASASTPGLVQIGSGLSIDSETGVISVTSSSSSSSSYTLPKATTTTLGGIKIGDGLTIEDGVASVDISAQYVQENTNEDERPSTLKTLFSLTQSQGKITANFQPIPDAFYTPGNTEEQIPDTYTHGLISAADLQKLYILNFNKEDDSEYFLINSREGRKGWVRGINNFIVYNTLSIQDLEVTDTSTQQSTIYPATLQIGETALNEDQLKDLLSLLQ